MPNSQNTSETIEKLSRIPLKDWAIIIGIIGGILTYYINTAGSNAKSVAQNEQVLKEISEMKSLIKEIQVENRNNYKELDKRTTDNSVSIKVLEQRLNEYDKRR